MQLTTLTEVVLQQYTGSFNSGRIATDCSFVTVSLFISVDKAESFFAQVVCVPYLILAFKESVTQKRKYCVRFYIVSKVMYFLLLW